MKNLNIKNKIRSIMVVAVILSSIVGIAGIFGMYQISHNEDKIHLVSVNATRAEMLASILLELRIEFRQTIVSLRDLDEVEEIIEKMNDCDREFSEQVLYLRNDPYLGEAETLLNEIDALYNSIAGYRSDFNIYARAQDEAKLVEWIQDNLSDALYLQTLCDDLSDYFITQAEHMSVSDSRFAIIMMIFMLVVTIVAIFISVVLRQYISGMIIEPIKKISQAAEKLAQGHIDIDIAIDSKDEIGDLSLSFQNMAAEIEKQAYIMKSIAQGDYTLSVHSRSNGDIMNQSMDYLIHTNNKSLLEIRNATDYVYTASEQISKVAQDLASGSSEQAASIDEFSAAIEEVLEQTHSNASSAAKALDATTKTGLLMEESTHSMELMTKAMDSILESSKRVAKVIKIIEDIAFQTNILALNAAVEAGRAGPHGKGFAVVADEVRNLASKSAAAAQETSLLIDDSLKHVIEGNEIVNKTNGSLSIVSDYSSQSLVLIQEIADSSNRQSSSISEINQGIAQVSKVVQANSTTAEESAAAAEEMYRQSEILYNIINRFKLKTDKITKAMPTTPLDEIGAFPEPEETYAKLQDLELPRPNSFGQADDKYLY